MLSVYFPDSTQIMHQNQGGEWFNDVMGFGAKYRSFQKPKSFPEGYGIYVDEKKMSLLRSFIQLRFHCSMKILLLRSSIPKSE